MTATLEPAICQVRLPALTTDFRTMPQPDPEEFAKIVLWHLCNLRTEIGTLKLQLADLQKALGQSPDSTTLQELELREQELFQATWNQACRAAKLDSNPPGQKPFGNP